MTDMNKVDVSVIIPCYNCEEYIEETLTSLKNQTFKNFEVVCVNDGSKDSTLSILMRWKNDGRLNMVVINQDNSGVSKARNKGISVAKGTYIMFLDSDDIYHPEMINSLFCSAQNVDVSYCKLSRNINEVRNLEVHSVNRVTQTQTECMQKLLYEMDRYGFYCYLYKREIIERIGLRFDENTKHFEDREFNWKYLCNCERILWIDAPLYGYRVNPVSVTQRPATWHTDGLDAIRRVESYLKEKDCEYVEEVESYLFARAIWGLAKAYTISRKKDLFCRLLKEYDVKKCMKRTLKDNNLLVSVASALYLIHPLLFYVVVGLKKN